MESPPSHVVHFGDGTIEVAPAPVRLTKSVLDFYIKYGKDDTVTICADGNVYLTFKPKD